MSRYSRARFLASAAGTPAISGDLHGEADVLQAGPLHQQVKLLEDHADGPAGLAQTGRGEFHQVLSVDEDLSLGGPLQQVDAAHQGGFTRAAHADDTKDIPIPNGQVDI